MKKKLVKVEEVTVVTVRHVLESLGIELVMWGKVIDETDPNEAYEPYAEMRDAMIANSEVILAVLRAFPKLLRAMKLPVPEGMAVYVIPNPLNESVEQDIPPEEETSSSNDFGDKLPF